MQKCHDVLVVGLGAFGSATAFHLSRLGLSVLGLEAGPHPGHELGSSHGHSRIIRLAYREGTHYVPLLKRSYQLFLDLQQECGKTLFARTGMLDIGPDIGTGPAAACAQQHGLSHQVLTATEVNKRFPGYKLPDTLSALYQPDGGVLAPEACIQAQCQGAQRAGAQLMWGQRVVRWWIQGPWMPELWREGKGLLRVVRQVVGWFAVRRPGLFDPQRFPVFILETATTAEAQGAQKATGQAWYGFPQWGPVPGFKIGLYNHLDQEVHPDSVDRGITAEDEEVLRAAVKRYFPDANGPLLGHSVCMFTNTPDGDFLVDRHTEWPQVMLCSACSGHGFKMSTGVGQLIAQDMAAFPVYPSDPGLSELAKHRLRRFWHAG